VLLERYAGAVYVGYYQISFRIIFALQFIPSAFAASIYPAMSSYWVSDKTQLKITFEKALVYLTIVALPISAGVVALADEIVMLFKSGYGEAVLPMRIIILSLIFIFVNFPLGSLLNACDRQKTNTKNIAIVTIFSIILNFALIPHFKAVGASLSVLVSSALMTGLGLFWANRIVSMDWPKLIRAMVKISCAASIMGVSVYLLKGAVGTWSVIPIGALLYTVIILALRTISKEEILHIFNSVFKK
jgi:O-antigen/teichoic acid export membrane protein